MAKIVNDELQALKKQATELGLEFASNANLNQMKALLETSSTPETSVPAVKEQTSNTQVSYDELVKQIADLKELVNQTGDSNKIREFEQSKETMNKFAFSVKLFPMRDYECPIINWRTISNFVDTSQEKIKADQVIEVTFIDKEGKKDSKEIQLVQFATFLKRTKPIIAKSIKNLDGSDVAVIQKINPETKLKYYTIHPNGDTFNVTLDVNGQELTILSTYLNA